MIKLANAFSIQMLTGKAEVNFTPVTVEYVVRKLQAGFESYIGHPDLAAVVTDVTGIEIPVNRASLQLTDDDVLIVAQYRGPRLAEGTTKLPEGATVEFWRVMII